MRRRRGFALLAVLWIIAGATIAGMALARETRSRVRAAVNRSEALRHEWVAEGCLARAIAALRHMQQGRVGLRGHVEPVPADSLPLLLASDPRIRDCGGTITLEPVGTAIGIGAAPSDVLRRALEAQPIARPERDSLLDAVLDWRDADDLPRPSGCERDCYRRLGRVPPRDAPIVDLRELTLVLGFDRWDSALPARTPLAQLFTSEPGRIAIGWAPAHVLAALPGLGRRGADELVARRRQGATFSGELADVARLLSSTARDSFTLHFEALSRLATATPDGWRLSASAPGDEGAGPQAAEPVVITARIVLTGSGMVVQSRRYGP